MLESLVNPKRLAKGPWKMFFIGLLYASLSLLLVKLFFGSDPVLSKYSGILVVTFCVMFTLPFIYFMIKQDEVEDERIEGIRDVWRVHKDAIWSFVWLFLGFVIAFSFWYIVLADSTMLNAQIETYCLINSPRNIAGCVDQYSIGSALSPTGGATNAGRFISILENNIYVMIFTIIFSLIFGAGAIFVLAWNATVIASAIGIFTNYKLSGIPLGLVRYMIHGIPEIAAYFVAALAGGILGAGFLRNGVKDKKFYHVLENTILLLFLSLIILVVAAVMEVYLTPLLH
ncbi:MAG: stage II sporulation protein M [Nanoarchaeota archaeon]|jgi:uncharacterized membrane protein SpoIIM required for sporulation|nr:stage II sporulation protein M [Nanoarchaeota archaeon]